MYIVKHQPDLSNSDFCGVINPGCNGVALSPNLTDWEVSVDTNKPQVVLRPPVPVSKKTMFCKYDGKNVL